MKLRWGGAASKQVVRGLKVMEKRKNSVIYLSEFLSAVDTGILGRMCSLIFGDNTKHRDHKEGRTERIHTKVQQEGRKVGLHQDSAVSW